MARWRLARKVRINAVLTNLSVSFEQQIRMVNGFDDFDAACEGLKKRQVEAVVFDSPAVLNRAIQDSDLKVADELFDPQKYGIAMREGDPLRERINRSVLGLLESDRYRYLQTKWFGSPDGG